MSKWRWGAVLALGALVFLAARFLPARAASNYGADARQFSSELQSGGAFKFAEDTEDQLRSGKFELAFARYLFLKSHIRGSSLYTALNAMVDQRLHFLKTQMGLPEIPHYAAPYKKLKSRVVKEAKAATPAEQKKGKEQEVAPKPGEEKPAETVIPGAPAVQTPTQPPEKEEKAEAEKPEAKKPPPPPPSTWERIKRRLKFW